MTGPSRRLGYNPATTTTWIAEEGSMSSTFKMITLVGTSESSYEEAIQSAVSEASKSLRHLGWFEVLEMRGRVQGGKAVEFQVKIQVGFKLED
jgi:dodecin